jgi:acyl-CoA hydrolase
MMAAPVDASLRVRLGTADTHYGGYLIPAATIMRLFADCTTEIGIRDNGRPGLLAAYESATFLKPLYVGDYIEVQATVIARGRRSRRIGLEAWRLVAALPPGTAGDHLVLAEPELIARAVMVSVAPRS